jgi:hypothetical protein
MKFNLSEITQEIDDVEPKVGDVYGAHGGKPTACWIVIAETESGNGVVVLGVTNQGKICTATTYNKIAFLDRLRIGRVDMEAFEFVVQRTAGMGRQFRNTSRKP